MCFTLAGLCCGVCQDSFYGHAESIVGICKDRAAATSRTLTLDLTPYTPVAMVTVGNTSLRTTGTSATNTSRFSSLGRLSGGSRLSSIHPAAGTPGRMSLLSTQTNVKLGKGVATPLTTATRTPSKPEADDELDFKGDDGDADDTPAPVITKKAVPSRKAVVRTAANAVRPGSKPASKGKTAKRRKQESSDESDGDDGDSDADQENEDEDVDDVVQAPPSKKRVAPKARK